ncbi:2-C-methyl-D-erythritol 4-phosphate cytidylyltransferase [Isosphaeraceae bacterium EP7]
MPRFALILPAAGRSTRFGSVLDDKKPYVPLDGRAVWLRAIDPFLKRDDVVQWIVVISPEDRELFERRYRPSVAFLDIQVVEGGAERFDSVAKGLAAIRDDCDHVAIHDAARPCVTPAIIDAVFAAAVRHGAALPGVAVADTLKRVDDQLRTVETVSRAGLYAVQTPQAFRKDLLLQAHAMRPQLPSHVVVTDDAQLVEATGHACQIVVGDAQNLKITTQADLALASSILKSRLTPEREPTPRRLGDEGELWD